ncbi:hypothetical protein [Parafrankia sp. CH37]|nr:hypothetical protein [Parafrankia sp. CH37]
MDRDRPVDRPRPAARARPRRALTVFKAVLVCVVLVVGVSIGRALAQPGDQGVPSRLADWARDNHLSVVVDQVKELR